MIWIGPFEAFLVAHKDSLGLVVSAVGSAAIIVAALQLGEAQRQRGIAESLQLFDKLDQQLADWSTSAQAEPLDEHRLDIAVGRLLSTYEIAANGINKSYLSRMASDLVLSLMLDTLVMTMRNEATRSATRKIAQNRQVYSAIGILLLKRANKVVAKDVDRHVRNTFFQGQAPNLFDRDLAGWIRRRVLVVKLQREG